MGAKVISTIVRKKKRELTTLLDGRRVPKYSLRPETYGTLDELNSFVGMARAFSKNRMVRSTLFTIQSHLFLIGSELALSGKNRSQLKGGITQKKIDWLIRLSTNFKTVLKLNPRFIIYGGTQISSMLDVAREGERGKLFLGLSLMPYLNVILNRINKSGFQSFEQKGHC